MIELLIVGMVIAVLAGTVASVINYQRHRIRTDNSIRRATLLKLVNVMETYRASELRYPTDPDSDGIPLDDPNLGTYLVDTWPNNLPPGAIYTYWTNAARNIMGLTVNASDNVIYKYRSTTGLIEDCNAPELPSDDLCD